MALGFKPRQTTLSLCSQLGSSTESASPVPSILPGIDPIHVCGMTSGEQSVLESTGFGNGRTFTLPLLATLSFSAPQFLCLVRTVLARGEHALNGHDSLPPPSPLPFLLISLSEPFTVDSINIAFKQAVFLPCFYYDFFIPCL